MRPRRIKLWLATFITNKLDFSVLIQYVQNEVNDKVRADKDVDGDKIIKQMADVIRQRFADRITALQELKQGVEEDYARSYGKSYVLHGNMASNITLRFQFCLSRYIGWRFPANGA